MPDPILRRVEERKVKEFFLRLKPADAITVKAVVNTVKSLADDYAGERSMMGQYSNAFFGVYAIAGNITKFGDRPDIDLLIATNGWWSNGYQSADSEISYEDSFALSGDCVAGTLRDIFSKEGYKVKVKKEIPSEYKSTGAKQKGMLQFVPENEGRKPIDIVIVNKVSLKDSGIRTLSEFEQQIDVDSNGNSLPKVLLFEA